MIDRYIYGMIIMIVGTMGIGLYVQEMQLNDSEWQVSKLERKVVNLKNDAVRVRFECKEAAYKSYLIKKMEEEYERTEVNITDGNYTIEL